MSAEILSQLESLSRKYARAAKKNNIERMAELDEEERELIRGLTPVERYDWNLKQASKAFNTDPAEIDAEIEERANSTDPAIKTGFLEGYMTASLEEFNSLVEGMIERMSRDLGAPGEHRADINRVLDNGGLDKEEVAPQTP